MKIRFDFEFVLSEEEISHLIEQYVREKLD
jgi:hypothetical protein